METPLGTMICLIPLAISRSRYQFFLLLILLPFTLGEEEAAGKAQKTVQFFHIREKHLPSSFGLNNNTFMIRLYLLGRNFIATRSILIHTTYSNQDLHCITCQTLLSKRMFWNHGYPHCSENKQDSFLGQGQELLTSPQRLDCKGQRIAKCMYF